MTLAKPPHKVTATVLGAGTMGAGIAAHLAAAGCRTFLLDIVPKDEGKDSPRRSKIAQQALAQLKKSRPPALMSEGVLSRIIAGNLEDDLERAVSASDLVIEAVVERADVKIELFQRVADAAGSETILASNTSGISIDTIASGLAPEPASRFLGLHFFNPPRWMYLLEVIPGKATKKSVVDEASDFCDRVLGKGIVLCEDTPNFIGNRIGIAEMLLTFRAAEKHGLTVEDVDFLNGPLLGRPKTGSFRLGDLVGIDVIEHVVKNLQNGLSADPGAQNFDPLYALMKVPPVVERLVSERRLGDKTGAGFYKKEKGPGGKSLVSSLDLQTLQYRPAKEPEFPALQQMMRLLDLQARIRAALKDEGPGGQFLRDVMVPLFNYSAYLAGTVCKTAEQIDEAMRWGYGWALGPFELLDAVGVDWVTEQIRSRGEEVAPMLVELESKSSSSVYQNAAEGDFVYVREVGYQPIELPSGMIRLSKLAQTSVIKENKSARLVNLGDGVACLEFLSKANILDEGVVTLIAEAPQFLHGKGFVGMVLGNEADHFCRGANLMHIAGMIGKKDFDGVEREVRTLQNSFMNLRHGPIPVVAAPNGQALGGGTEACLHSAEIQAGADLFMGLVEVGVGVLPAGGGLKEIARRASAWAAQMPGQDPYPWVRRGFEAVATAKVSMSAIEARETGFLSPNDGISFNKRRILADAKRRVLALSQRGWTPPDDQEPISVIGSPGGANLMMGVQVFNWGGYASEYDMHIGKKVVHVLSGGMKPGPSQVTAQYLLDLEREAFVSLCGEQKTFDRITHMLKTKKPLRN